MLATVPGAGHTAVVRAKILLKAAYILVGKGERQIRCEERNVIFLIFFKKLE